jgi:Zn-dependent peptidase ImmA (M78 family)
LLHREIIDTSINGISDNVLYRSGEAEHIEYEANRLAADIVMPSEVIEGIIKREYRGIVTEATIEALAAKFQVSKAAMEIRLSTYSKAA